MAKNSKPSNDFAPPWLKIPDSLEILQANPSTYLKGDHHLNESDQSRRKQRLFFPSRHHSIDVDDSKYYRKDDLKDGRSNENDGRLKYSSVPSLQKRPHSRHDFRTDEFSSSNYHRPQSGSKGRFQQLGPSRSGPKFDQVVPNSEPVESFNDQFPSLGTSLENEPDGSNRSASSNGGVWDNSYVNKIHRSRQTLQPLQKSGKSNEDDRQTTSGASNGHSHPSNVDKNNKFCNQSSSLIYRAFVPKNNTSRKSSKDVHSASTQKETACGATTSIKIMSPPAILRHKPSEDGNCDSTHLEILVKNPANHSNKSSSKKLKNPPEEKCSDDRIVEKEGRSVRHPLRPEDHLLSSSLEAEQRLLREMGWKDEGSGDEDVYAPLTEQELREFRDLSVKMADRRPVRTAIASPKKFVQAFDVTDARATSIVEDDWSSSTSSDSD